MHRGFAILSGWVDGFALPKEVLSERNALSTFPKKSFLELFCFVQSTFLGEEGLRAEEYGRLKNPIANVGVVTVDKRSIDEGIASYTSATRLLQENLEE